MFVSLGLQSPQKLKLLELMHWLSCDVEKKPYFVLYTLQYRVIVVVQVYYTNILCMR